MTVKKDSFVIKGTSGKDIVCDVSYNEGAKNQSIIVLAHGFKGFKDWGHFNLLADHFVNEGFAFLKFNFSHNGGTIENPIDFPDLSAFADNDFIKELKDLKAVVDFIHGKGSFVQGNSNFRKYLDNKRLGLIGHSRGGGIATIFASEDSRVKSLCLWASVSDFEARLPAGEKMDEWKRKGVVYIENGRTKQMMPMNYSFVRSFLENKERLSIKSAAAKIDVPTLIVQGGEDPVVLPSEGKNLAAWISKASYRLIQEGDHVFGSAHPYPAKGELVGQLPELFALTTAHFKNSL